MWLLVPLALFTFLLLLLYSKQKPNPNPPPSPFRLPIIGNLHQLGQLPHRSLRSLAAKHGPLMLLRLGRVPLLVVSSPAMARAVMKTQDHLFANRPALKVSKRLLYDGKDIAFAPYGEYWKQVRKFAVHYLLSPTKVHFYRRVREEEVGMMLEKIRQAAAKGELVNVSDTLNWLARDIIIRIALGRSSRDNEWSRSITNVIEESSRLLGDFLVSDYVPWLAWVDAVAGLDEKIERSFRQADEILDGIVEKETERDGGQDSFIEILVALEKDKNRGFEFSKENIKAIVKDLFGAGTDSTYIAMEWVMAELIKNPKTLHKLQQEIRGIAKPGTTIREQDLTKMDYLRAVIKEALRLHPVGPLLVPRELMEDTQIAGYDVPRGTWVVTNVWAIGRDPKVWESPEEFWPERFLNSRVDFKGQDFELTPFGAGRRMCPGITFASTVIELAVANLVHQFDWNLPNGMETEELDMVEASGLTARKRIDLVLEAKHCL